VGERAFFQIAVGLIPVLLFGGFLFSRSNPPKPKVGFKFLDALVLFGIALLGVLAIAAETVAIGGAIGAQPETQGRVLVIVIILLGMVLVVLGGVVPRAMHLISTVPVRQSYPLQALLVLIAVVFVAAAVVSARQIDKAIRIGTEQANVRRVITLQAQVDGIYHREDARRRRLNALFFEWEKLILDPSNSRALDRIHLRTLKQEIRAEERSEHSDFERSLELEHEIRMLLYGV
jgi:hypothetical protein